MKENSLVIFENYQIRRHFEERSEAVTKCHQLKMVADDGKMRK
jgi:hypothetical protein